MICAHCNHPTHKAKPSVDEGGNIDLGYADGIYFNKFVAMINGEYIIKKDLYVCDEKCAAGLFSKPIFSKV